MIRIYYSNESELDMSAFEPVLKEVIEGILERYTEYRYTQEISVTFTDNKSIRELNHRFRHIDKITDVLSFPMYNSWREWPATGQAVVIGDIVISVEQAVSQSEAYGHSLKRELGFLTAHSMLHLIGYDHITPEDEDIMCRLQEEILMKAGLVR